MPSSCPPRPLVSSSPQGDRERGVARKLRHRIRDRQGREEKGSTRVKKTAMHFLFSESEVVGKVSPRERASSAFSLSFHSLLPHGDALVLVLGRERAHGEVEAAEASAAGAPAEGREGLVVVSRGGGKGEHRLTFGRSLSPERERSSSDSLLPPLSTEPRTAV